MKGLTSMSQRSEDAEIARLRVEVEHWCSLANKRAIEIHDQRKRADAAEFEIARLREREEALRQAFPVLRWKERAEVAEARIKELEHYAKIGASCEMAGLACIDEAGEVRMSPPPELSRERIKELEAAHGSMSAYALGVVAVLKDRFPHEEAGDAIDGLAAKALADALALRTTKEVA